MNHRFSDCPITLFLFPPQSHTQSHIDLQNLSCQAYITTVSLPNFCPVSSSRGFHIVAVISYKVHFRLLLVMATVLYKQCVDVVSCSGEHCDSYEYNQSKKDNMLSGVFRKYNLYILLIFCDMSKVSYGIFYRASPSHLLGLKNIF